MRSGHDDLALEAFAAFAGFDHEQAPSWARALAARCRALLSNPDGSDAAFEDALSDDEIDAVIGYLRKFCTDTRWVRGEFNFALGFFTEKAFPEDELLWTNAIDARKPNNIESQFVFEKRVGPTGQIELTLPFARIDGGPGIGKNFGIGDVGLAWKQNIIADVDSGTILSLLGEAVFPTGSETNGLGTGFPTLTTDQRGGDFVRTYDLTGGTSLNPGDGTDVGAVERQLADTTAPQVKSIQVNDGNAQRYPRRGRPAEHGRLRRPGLRRQGPAVRRRA